MGLLKPLKRTIILILLRVINSYFNIKVASNGALSGLSNTKKTAAIFYRYFLNFLNTSAFTVKSNHLSEDFLFFNSKIGSRDDSLAKSLDDIRFSDCIFFVKPLASDCFAVILVPSLDSCALVSCESELSIITPVVLFECNSNSSVENIDCSLAANINFKLIRKTETESHLFLSKGESSAESGAIQNLISDIEGIYYECWFNTACVSLGLWGKIDFCLDHNILNRCTRKVERVPFSNILRLFIEADISLYDLKLCNILYNWISVDCNLEGKRTMLWTHMSENVLPQEPVNHFFVQLSIEGEEEGSNLVIPLFDRIGKIPESFKDNSSIVSTLLYFEPQNYISGNELSVVSHVKTFFNSFALNELCGAQVDDAIIKTLLDDLISNETSGSEIESVFSEEYSAYLIGEEEVSHCHLLDVLGDSESDKFLIKVANSLITVKVINDCRFWLFVELSSGKYLLKYYTSQVSVDETNDVINSLNVLMNQAIFRTNQLCFLNELNENRMAR